MTTKTQAADQEIVNKNALNANMLAWKSNNIMEFEIDAYKLVMAAKRDLITILYTAGHLKEAAYHKLMTDNRIAQTCGVEDIRMDYGVDCLGGL